MISDTAAGQERRRFLNQTTVAQRTLSTTHPIAVLVAAGLFALAGLIGGALLAASGKVGGGIALMLVGVVFGALIAVPGWWSQRHREQARTAVTLRSAMQNESIRRHPRRYLLITPIVVAAAVATRLLARHLASGWPVAVGAVGAGLVALLIAVVQVRRVHSGRSAVSREPYPSDADSGRTRLSTPGR